MVLLLPSLFTRALSVYPSRVVLPLPFGFTPSLVCLPLPRVFTLPYGARRWCLGRVFLRLVVYGDYGGRVLALALGSCGFVVHEIAEPNAAA